jgi:hypothetical protein
VALLGVLEYTPGEPSMPFRYGYVGADEEMTVTTFYSKPSVVPRKHIIANVDGIDDDVLFWGDVFLGVIRDPQEEKVSFSTEF